jgi:hypothetical protein
MYERQNSTDAAFDGLIESALKIANHDAALRKSLKDAVVRGDAVQALHAACSLVGVEPSGSILALLRNKAA